MFFIVLGQLTQHCVYIYIYVLKTSGWRTLKKYMNQLQKIFMLILENMTSCESSNYKQSNTRGLHL